MRLARIILALCLASPLGAAVAYDATSESALTATDLDASWTHTPVGTPRGVALYCISIANDDAIGGVTYGGVAMTEVTGSPIVKTSTEIIQVHAYFLGSGIPTGAQTIVADGIGGGADDYICRAFSVTADDNTALAAVDATINSSSVTNPSITLALGGKTSFVSIGFMSGQGVVTGTTPFSGWTSVSETDFGAQVGGFYRYDTIGSTDVTSGWTQSADDAVAIVVGITEVAAGTAGAARSSLMLLGVGR